MLGERIKIARKNMGLTQQEFADAIGLKRTSIATYETGKSFPSDRTISDICSKFGVDEIWLREGIGEMFAEKSEYEELSKFFGDVLADKPDYRHAFITLLARMTLDEWKLFEKKAWELHDLMEKQKDGP